MPSNFILIPYGLAFIRLTPAEFDAAMGRGLVPAQIAAPGQPAAAGEAEPWLDSRQLAALTGIGDTWWEQAAREGRVPSIRAGKALRFKLSEAEAALRAQDDGAV